MLLNKIDNSIKRKKKLEEHESIKTRLKVLDENLAEAKEVNTSLDQLLEVKLVLDNLGYSIINIDDKLISTLKDLTQRDLEDYEVNDNLTITLMNLNKKLSEIDKRYEEFWKNYYTEYYSETSNILKLLKEIIKDRDLIVLSNELEKYSDSWPINNKKLRVISNNKNKALKYIENINVNDKIKTFLTDLVNNSVTLSSLDDEILSWISKNNLEDNIVLKIK